MLFKLTTAAGLALSLALLTVSCKTKPPRQAEVDDVLTDKGADMSSGEDPRNGNAKEGAEGGKGEAEMHEKCCGQCKEGLAQDRTGQKPDTIPCADYTSILDPFCLEHFRGKKTMASQCK